MEKIPVFIINGFLDSGKTTFINTIIMSDGFYKTGNTLLIAYEDGEMPYNEKFLKEKFNTTVFMTTGSIGDEKLEQLITTNQISRIIIENNVMLEEELFKINNLEISQVVTIIDSNSFEMFYTNLRTKIAEMIRTANIVIFNRIDEKMQKLLSYKRTLSLLNNQADYIFQNSKGELIETLTDELPYDLETDIIEIKDENYNVFFFDSFDNKERYINKIVSLNAMSYVKDEVVLGRLAMPCCEDDVMLLGFISKIQGEMQNNNWYNIVAIVEYEKITDVEEPVLKVLEYKKIEKIKDPIIVF